MKTLFSLYWKTHYACMLPICFCTVIWDFFFNPIQIANDLDSMRAEDDHRRP